MNAYAEVLDGLRSAYDSSAADGDADCKSDWKLVERRLFLERLQAEHKTRMLELGAGTGQDGVFFQSHGLEVVATDASAAMVARCRAKGLEAHVMDFLELAFSPGSFDSAYAMNCLLHVPNADMPHVLAAIRTVLKPGGLLYVGVYGGETFEGIKHDDWHDPPRFFSFRTDNELERMVTPHFELVDFHTVERDFRFQALTLRA